MAMYKDPVGSVRQKVAGHHRQVTQSRLVKSKILGPIGKTQHQGNQSAKPTALVALYTAEMANSNVFVEGAASFSDSPSPPLPFEHVEDDAFSSLPPLSFDQVENDAPFSLFFHSFDNSDNSLNRTVSVDASIGTLTASSGQTLTGSLFSVPSSIFDSEMGSAVDSVADDAAVHFDDDGDQVHDDQLDLVLHHFQLDAQHLAPGALANDNKTFSKRSLDLKHQWAVPSLVAADMPSPATVVEEFHR